MCDPVPGRGTACMVVFQDCDRARLMGERSYPLRVPDGVPASLFWSTVCHDNRTRTLIQTEQQGATVGPRRKGFAATTTAPSTCCTAQRDPRHEGVQLDQTIPGRGFFVQFSLYGVDQPFFDKTLAAPSRPADRLRHAPSPHRRAQGRRSFWLRDRSRATGT